MFVCICNKVTDRDIQQAAYEGCCSMRQLKKQTGLGTQCGSCCDEACDILKETLSEVKAAEGFEPATT